jgi:hypothetical protein
MPKTVADVSRDRDALRSDRARRGFGSQAAARPGRTSMLDVFRGLPVEQQRFAVLLTEAVRGVAEEVDLPESEIRNLIYRLVQAGVIQERRAPEARKELARALGPSLADLDPVPYATVEQARRLAALRASLLRHGALSTSAIASARGMTPNNARQWISRHRRSNHLFTVTHDGETLVPAFLLDDELEPRPGPQGAIKALREAGEDGWALWAWFAMPSGWLGGRVPAEVLVNDPELVAESARQRAAAAA